MKNYIKAEFLKTKQTTLMKMIFFIPILCVIVGAGFCALGGTEVMVLGDITSINHWGLLWLPAMVAIMSGLMHNHEKKSTEYKMILGMPSNQGKVWLAKCFVIASYTQLASFVLWIFLLLYDLMFIRSFASVQVLANCLAALLISFVAVLWQIPLFLWLSQKLNYFLLILLNAGLSIMIAPVYAPKANWWAVPSAWLLRMEAPFLKLHPNGIPLEAGDSLLSFQGFAPALIFCVVLSITAILVTKILFEKKEVK